MQQVIIDEESSQRERLLNYLIGIGGKASTIAIARWGLENGISQATRRIRELRQKYPAGLGVFNHPELLVDSRPINPPEMEQWGIKCKRIAVYYIKPKEQTTSIPETAEQENDSTRMG